MTIPQGKRRRMDGGVCLEAGAEGTAAASHAALSATMRASLSEAVAAAALAANARMEATEVTARSMAEVSTAAARSIAACQAAKDASAQVVASASALARELGIEAGDGGDVAARGVERFETALTSKGARGGGNGGDGVALQISEAASASKVGQGDGGGNGSFTVFHLPDAVIEKIFDHLHWGVRCDEQKVDFPCRPALARFSLSCRRFARLFRGSYVTNIQFNAIFRFAKDAREYQEVMSGALSRFTNACSVTVTNFDCFSEPGQSASDALVVDADNDYVLDGSRELDFRLAVADRSSMAEAVAGRIGDFNGRANVKSLRFKNGRGFSQSLLHTGSVSWKGECARWLDYLPTVTDVFFNDFEAFCNSSRSCGANRASLKTLGFAWDDDTITSSGFAEPWNSYMFSFLHFRNIETLVLSVENFGGDPAGLEVLMLPRVLELLPKLDDFGILLRNLTQYPQDRTVPPLMQSLFRNSSLPVEGRCKLRVHIGILHFHYFDDVEDTLKALRTILTGDSLPEWEVTGQPESATLFQGRRGLARRACNFDVAAVATFRPTPGSM